MADQPFTFRVNKERKVLIYWQGKLVMTLKGKDSEQFLARISAADAAGAQLVMAKATGNFKHGNERQAKSQQ